MFNPDNILLKKGNIVMFVPEDTSGRKMKNIVIYQHKHKHPLILIPQIEMSDPIGYLKSHYFSRKGVISTVERARLTSPKLLLMFMKVYYGPERAKKLLLPYWNARGEEIQNILYKVIMENDK